MKAPDALMNSNGMYPDLLSTLNSSFIMDPCHACALFTNVFLIL
eukprot:CAMPEP_0204638424 /NCGR_PEP_ID=MMETSP0717-20131115/39506_1 /ASSEMBLY_ACC=CAM_ASM_000666 /TAXON_ID=230516 /ORGANISM="Chaetoceros curvisetus" /LENGTH=43 /DNA_ID= /DNA_START= /DNA_END= /DNA_ORIENTATION=